MVHVTAKQIATEIGEVYVYECNNLRAKPYSTRLMDFVLDMKHFNCVDFCVLLSFRSVQQIRRFLFCDAIFLSSVQCYQ